MGTPTRKTLSFRSDRQFGIELELNAADGKDRPEPGQRPAGIDDISMVVAKHSVEGVEVRDWEHTHNNEQWVIKPDSSCGMEVCTPILKGWNGLRKVCEVVEAFGESTDPEIKVDHRTSVHVHVSAADLNNDQVGSIIAWWMKCEPVFMDSVPPARKRNRYCQVMGFNNIVQVDQKVTPSDLLRRVGQVKYYSLNASQMLKSDRRTIEFRIVEGLGCKDPFLIKNWTRLLIHFVDMTSRRPFPADFVAGNPFTGFCWLDPQDVFKVLGFDPEEYDLSPGLQQTRNWFLARLQANMAKDVNEGYRQYAYREFQAMLERYAALGVTITPEDHLKPPQSKLKPSLYSEELRL